MVGRHLKNGPGLAIERKLFASGCETIAGIDEVGRGAWAGPVAVGVAVVTKATMKRFPPGVRDSKQLTPLARDRLFDPLRLALRAHSIGYASAKECDDLGMTRAQALATKRALSQLELRPDGVIVDGVVNFTDRDDAVVVPKADQKSMVVAAASVLAKVTRDRLMIECASRYPLFSFERNKGYGSFEHRSAVAIHGMTDLHRKTWSFAVLADDAATFDREIGGSDTARL